MSTFRAVLTELAGLFLDDALLAVMSLLWIAAVGFVRKVWLLSPATAGAALLAGPVVFLLVSVWRAAAPRRHLPFYRFDKRAAKPSRGPWL
jgi:hypothetical protein